MRVLVFGGTGTLGKAFIEAAYNQAEIAVFSRDELKQKQLCEKWPVDRVFLGDIRSYDDVKYAFDEFLPDQVFHFAALKHVDVGEQFPEQFYKTNVEGTRNILRAYEKSAHAEKLAFSSTDKAVDPINAYGYSKAMAEKLLLASPASGVQIFRWGNVLGSRGSALPMFSEKIKKGDPVPITDPEMSRFWIKISDAVEFMVRTTEDGVHIPPNIRASKLLRMIEAIRYVHDAPEVMYNCVGLRPGEKLHERLISEHEKQEIDLVSSNINLHYTDEELQGLVLEEIV